MNKMCAVPDRDVIVLDLDGTLITCQHRQVALAEHLSDRYASSAFDSAAFWEAKRAGASTLAALRTLGFTHHTASLIATEWALCIEDESWIAYDVLIPGALRALEQIASAGLGAIVLTARRNARGVARQLTVMGITPWLIHTIVVSPFRAVEDKARVLIDLMPQAFIGDSESDAAAAKRAGVPFLAVSTGQRGTDFWSAYGEEHPFPSVEAAVEEILSSRTPATR